jgi:hypothetical protein
MPASPASIPTRPPKSGRSMCAPAAGQCRRSARHGLARAGAGRDCQPARELAAAGPRSLRGSRSSPPRARLHRDAGAREQRESLTAAIASLERQRSLAASQIGSPKPDPPRAALAAEGAGSQRQVEESRAEVLARRAEVESINERIITQRETLRAIDAPDRAAPARSQAAAAIASRAQRAALAEQRAALLRTDQLTLTAPVAAKSGTSARSRPAGPAGHVARHHRAARQPLEVWLYAPSRAVGFVRPGQEVRLLFDAFPLSEIRRRARHRHRSLARADRARRDRPALGIEEPVFRIRVAIDEVAPRVRAPKAAPPGHDAHRQPRPRAAAALGSDLQPHQNGACIMSGIEWPWSERSSRCCSRRKRNAASPASR